MKKIAIYPGSFDPVTFGHINIMERSAKLFDEVILLIGINSAKKTLFTLDERVEMSRKALRHLPNIRVDSFAGLTVDYMKKANASAIIRGIRSAADFEYEFQIAALNKKLYPEAETIFLAPDEKFAFVNSTAVREFARYSADLSELVPAEIAEAVQKKMELSREK